MSRTTIGSFNRSGHTHEVFINNGAVYYLDRTGRSNGTNFTYSNGSYLRRDGSRFSSANEVIAQIAANY